MNQVTKYEDYEVTDEPYYEEIDGEINDFEIAFLNKRPLALIGPTGCGKTQLAEHMAYKLRKDLLSGKYRDNEEIGNYLNERGKEFKFPYIEIPCHEDMTETHLLGRYDLDGKWKPGPLYLWAKNGGIACIDEIVEARKDSVVLLHAPTDDRRQLLVAKTREVIDLPPTAMLVACWNPGYQVKSKDLKPSTRQRFSTMVMDYPPYEKEVKIVTNKTGIDLKIAQKIVKLANEIRNAKSNDSIELQEGASTRLLIMAAESYIMHRKLGLTPDLRRIIRTNIFNPITNEETDKTALESILSAL